MKSHHKAILLVLICLSAILFSLMTQAEGMDACMMMKNQNDKNFCMAKYSGSAAFCDRITIYERRYDCMRMVIRKQRENR
jgi:hypothetical protein